MSTELAHDILECLLVFFEQSGKLFIVILKLHVLLNKSNIHPLQFRFESLCGAVVKWEASNFARSYLESCAY
jgi:hypothetical protein